jgi:hypothetical protein
MLPSHPVHPLVKLSKGARHWDDLLSSRR